MTKRTWPALLLLAGLAGCFTPDFDYPRTPSYALDPNTTTTAKAEIDEWLAANPGPSGFYPLVRGTDALGARLRFMEAAEKTIDAQYFLMKSDSAGFVFGAALLAAADRGVRVRLLLDDIFTSISGEEMALLNGHPNIELRLFNPISRRGFMGLNFLGDFARANRRMHNKSFIVDNQAAIVGGRNIADEYFDLRAEGEFLDFDMIAIGPIAAEVSEQFDSFWNHERALPAEAAIGKYGEEAVAELREQMEVEHITEAREVYREAVDSDLMRNFDAGTAKLYSAEAFVLTDSPDKLSSEISEEHMILVGEMVEICRAAASEIIVISPYFVPGNDGVAFWKEQADRGVRVVVITNSLASNNHTAVHSGYARYREDIIRAGIELREARADAVDQPEQGEVGSKSLTLHTKAMIFDRERLFVGSLNLDPRSIEINSEMGMIVDSKEMVGGIADRVLANVDDWSYQVVLDEQGRIRWHQVVDDETVVLTTEPLTSCWKRFSAWFQKLAPERQL